MQSEQLSLDIVQSFSVNLDKCDLVPGQLTSVEICAGAGGQALGLEMAGFHHIALIEYESDYCATLRKNRPNWNVICGDVHDFSGINLRGKIDLLAGGVPCPPFSVAGKQLGSKDERDLFPEAIRLISEIKPKAVMSSKRYSKELSTIIVPRPIHQSGFDTFVNFVRHGKTSRSEIHLGRLNALTLIRCSLQLIVDFNNPVLHVH